MTPEELQKILDCAALELWALEDVIAIEGSDFVKAAVKSLHAKALTLATVLAKDNGLTIPEPSQRSGGGGK